MDIRFLHPASTGWGLLDEDVTVGVHLNVDIGEHTDHDPSIDHSLIRLRVGGVCVKDHRVTQRDGELTGHRAEGESSLESGLTVVLVGDVAYGTPPESPSVAHKVLWEAILVAQSTVDDFGDRLIGLDLGDSDHDLVLVLTQVLSGPSQTDTVDQLCGQEDGGRVTTVDHIARPSDGVLPRDTSTVAVVASRSVGAGSVRKGRHKDSTLIVDDSCEWETRASVTTWEDLRAVPTLNTRVKSDIGNGLGDGNLPDLGVRVLGVVGDSGEGLRLEGERLGDSDTRVTWHTVHESVESAGQQLCGEVVAGAREVVLTREVQLEGERSLVDEWDTCLHIEERADVPHNDVVGVLDHPFLIDRVGETDHVHAQRNLWRGDESVADVLLDPGDGV